MRRATVLVLTSLVALAGCGQSNSQQVRDTVQSFRDATASRDYGKICDDILSRALLDRLGQLGLPCRTALSKYLATTRDPRIAVKRVQVRGKTAVAFVQSSAAGQPPSNDQIQLVKEQDGWRISSLASGTGGSGPTGPGGPSGTD